MGISTFLYFETLTNLIILTFILTIVYSIFSLTTNIIASSFYKHSHTIASLASSDSYVALSLGSKQLDPTDKNKTYYIIQCWLGVAVLCLWLTMLFYLKHK
jgi:hypothetical protein